MHDVIDNGGSHAAHGFDRHGPAPAQKFEKLFHCMDGRRVQRHGPLQVVPHGMGIGQDIRLRCLECCTCREGKPFVADRDRHGAFFVVHKRLSIGILEDGGNLGRRQEQALPGVDAREFLGGKVEIDDVHTRPEIGRGDFMDHDISPVNGAGPERRGGMSAVTPYATAPVQII